MNLGSKYEFICDKNKCIVDFEKMEYEYPELKIKAKFRFNKEIIEIKYEYYDWITIDYYCSYDDIVFLENVKRLYKKFIAEKLLED